MCRLLGFHRAPLQWPGSVPAPAVLQPSDGSALRRPPSFCSRWGLHCSAVLAEIGQQRTAGCIPYASASTESVLPGATYVHPLQTPCPRTAAAAAAAVCCCRYISHFYYFTEPDARMNGTYITLQAGVWALKACRCRARAVPRRTPHYSYGSCNRQTVVRLLASSSYRHMPIVPCIACHVPACPAGARGKRPWRQRHGGGVLPCIADGCHGLCSLGAAGRWWVAWLGLDTRRALRAPPSTLPMYCSCEYKYTCWLILVW